MPDAEPPVADAGLELDTPRTVHVIAVGGSAMSGIATVLAGLGHRVTGSDLVDSPRLAHVRAAGVVVHVGHDAVEPLGRRRRRRRVERDR